MKRRWFIILLAILLLVISRLVWRQLQTDPVEPSPGSARFAYRIDDLVLTILDPQGNEQVTIRSPLLVDGGEGQPSELSDPIITAPDGNGIWQLSARKALIDRNNEHVTLLGDVVLQSLNPNENLKENPGQKLSQNQNSNLNPQGPIRVETPQAELDIQAKALSSAEIVTITQSGMRLQGRGLSGNLEQETYVLHQDVHAEFTDEQ